MSRSHQDSVIDDDEETCPLCIEEFDLGDKNFRPCPCGYQICQFCFNSLKNTYDKSTCPNCRRPYDEKTIQYKIPTAEDIKQDLLNKNKKQIAAKRKETEKKEVEASGRRNLAGVRVKQQNLVYIIGLVPSIKDEHALLQTLRGEQYFGQYGEIEKIVVSKAKPGAANQGIGVYVTFARKEDAAMCISMVDGSQNGDRILRAQYGTTKYCSAYLRGETCNNKNCTFLHESGEEGQSTSLQNEPSKRIATVAHTSHPLNTRPATTIPAAIQPPRSTTSDRKGSTDASALPTTASWATKEAQQAMRARRESQTASRSSPSPKVATATIAYNENKRKDSATPPVTQATKPVAPAAHSTISQGSSGNSSPKPSKANRTLFDDLIDSVNSPNFRFVFDDTSFSKEDLAAIYRVPTLIDPFGGAKRRLMREKEANERAKLEAEAQDKLQATAASTVDAIEDEQMGGGSLQLGGEPEESSLGLRRSGTQSAIGRPLNQIQANNAINDQFSNLNIDGRSLTPHQRQQLALLSSANVPQAPGLTQQSQTGFSAGGFDPTDQRSNPFTSQQLPYESTSGHARQSSRYSFANESTKSATNTRFPQPNAPAQQHYFPSGVQGPPPGLKTAGTPPISGGGMFAQGHGFTTNMNAAFGNSKDGNQDMFLRGRSGTGAGPDTKHEQDFPPLGPPSNIPQSSQISRFFPNQDSLDSVRRSGTPKVPPGLSLPHGHPPPGLATPERAGTPAQTPGVIAPALPLVPIDQRTSSPTRTPSHAVKPATPMVPEKTPANKEEEHEATKEHMQQIKADAISTGSPKPRTAKVAQIHPPAHAENEQAETKDHDTPSKTSRAPKPQKIDLSQVKLPAAAPASVDTSKPIILDQTSLVGTPLSLSRPATPGTTASRTPDPASAPRPRTIRLTTTSATSKPTDSSLPSAATDKSSSVPAVEALKIHSRRPSVASMSRSSRPASPAISEMATSSLNLSRAGSPPPSIVGSAPERFKSKNQLKKERRAKAKEVDEASSSTSAPQKAAGTPTPQAEEVGPIVSRQKKKKKPQENPSFRKPKVETSAGIADEKASEPEQEKPIESPVKRNKKEEVKAQSDVKESVEAEKSPIPESPAQSESESPSPDLRPYIPTLRDFYQDLKAHAVNTKAQDLASLVPELLDQYITDAPAVLATMFQENEVDPSSALFNPPSLNSYRLPHINAGSPAPARGKDNATTPSEATARNSAAYELTFGPQGSFSGQFAPAYPFGTVTLTNTERKVLFNGNAIRINDPSKPNDLHTRVMVTPRGTVYRHMSAEEEERVLELEGRMDNASLLGLYGPDDIDDDVADEYGNEYGDFENLRGGVDELIKRPARHGIVWVSGGSASRRYGHSRRKADHQPKIPSGPQPDNENDDQSVQKYGGGTSADITADDGYDQDDEEGPAGPSDDDHSQQLGSEDTSSFGDEDEDLLSILPTSLYSSLPPQLQSDPRFASATSATLTHRNASSTPSAALATGLRNMDIASLISKINVSKAEMDALKKEAEMLEKKIVRRGKDVTRWRDGIMTAAGGFAAAAAVGGGFRK